MVQYRDCLSRCQEAPILQSASMMVKSVCTLNESSGKLEDDGEDREKSMKFIVGISASEDHTGHI